MRTEQIQEFILNTVVGALVGFGVGFAISLFVFLGQIILAKDVLMNIGAQMHHVGQFKCVTNPDDTVYCYKPNTKEK